MNLHSGYERLLQYLADQDRCPAYFAAPALPERVDVWHEIWMGSVLLPAVQKVHPDAHKRPGRLHAHEQAAL